jgi:hypothetical protein
MIQINPSENTLHTFLPLNWFQCKISDSVITHSELLPIHDCEPMVSRGSAGRPVVSIQSAYILIDTKGNATRT